jgi:hypothetical protein
MSGTRDTSVRRSTLQVAAFLLLLLPWTLSAQATVDARTAEFGPSADHNQISNGTAVVSSYQMQIFNAGTTQLVQTVNLGKPSPQTDGKIRVDFVILLTSPLATGVHYAARVAAVGPGGSTASELSNTFTYSTPCAYAISPTSRSSPAAGESTSVSVTAGSGCAWSATSNAAWLTVASGATGSGNGSVGVGVAPNTGTVQRSGSVTIAGKLFSVTQPGVPCTFTVSPQTIAVPSTQTSGTIAVTTLTGCAWTVTDVPSWMTVTASTQTGPGEVSYTVAANSGQSRSATLVLAGQSATVSQAGTSRLLAPSNLKVTAKGPQK